MPNEADTQKNIFIVSPEEGGKFNPKDSMMITGELSHYFSGLKSNQKLVLQYADKGLAHNMVDQGGGWYDVWSINDSAKGYRVIQAGDLPITDNISLSHVLTYGKADEISRWRDSTELLSAVGRGQYAWTKNQKTYLEVGAYQKKIAGKRVQKPNTVVRNTRWHTPSALIFLC